MPLQQVLYYGSQILEGEYGQQQESYSQHSVRDGQSEAILCGYAFIFDEATPNFFPASRSSPFDFNEYDRSRIL